MVVMSYLIAPPKGNSNILPNAPFGPTESPLPVMLAKKLKIPASK
jgi:hypothetical protein